MMDALPETEWKYSLKQFVWNSVHGPGVGSAETWALQQTREDRIPAAIQSVHKMVIESAREGRSGEKLAEWILATEDGSPEADGRARSLLIETLNRHPENGVVLLEKLKNDSNRDAAALAEISMSTLSDKTLPVLLEWAGATADRELGELIESGIAGWRASRSAADNP